MDHPPGSITSSQPDQVGLKRFCHEQTETLSVGLGLIGH